MDSLGEILCVSINHRTAELAVREALVFDQNDVGGFLSQLVACPGVREASMISTCNRTEVFTVIDAEGDVDSVPVALELLSQLRGFVAEVDPGNFQLFRNELAVQHLFRVAAGLDSQLLGESEILGQVKRAGVVSRRCGSSGRILGKLWEWAVRVGKRVRSETALGQGAMSASYAALELARKVFGSLASKQVLVIGAGEIAVLTLENLQGVAIQGCTVVNRSRDRAEEVAKRFDARVLGFDELDDALVHADLVISSTGSPEPIVTFDRMKKIRRLRHGDEPALIVDLALPRDFEKRVGTLDAVFLKNLDDLEVIVAENREQRAAELPRAEFIVEVECESFSDWLRIQVIEPTILLLRDRFDLIREEELERIRGQLDPEVFAHLDRLTRRLVKRLLHTPSANLRRHSGLRDREVYRVLHDVLTQELPHPKATRGSASRESDEKTGGDGGDV